MNQGYLRFTYVFLTLFFVSVLVGVGYSAYQDRQAQLTFQLQRAQANALMLEDQITQTFQFIESAAMTLPELSEATMLSVRHGELTRWLLRLQHSQPALRSLSVMGEDHVIKVSTNAANLGVRVMLDTFAPADTGQGFAANLRIGQVQTGRDWAGDGLSEVHYFFPIALRLGQEKSHVWVVAAVNPDYFLNRMERYKQHENDRYEWVRFDGHVLVSSGNVLQEPMFSKPALISEIHRHEIGTHIDRWLTAYRASVQYPFFVAFHIDQEAVLAQWVRGFWSLVSWTLAALCAVLGVTVVMIRHFRISEEVERRQQMELLASRDKAEAATRAKSQFLANMSHEIRTPMNGVIGMTQLALEESLPERAKTYVQSAHTAAVSLLGVLNDVLDFSKIEAGKLEIESVAFNLPELLHTVIAMQRLMAEGKKLNLKFELDPATPVWIESDSLRMTQILNNLLGNAVKFASRGVVTLRVYATPDQVLHLQVQDEGVGMTPTQVANLFVPFNQADSSTTRVFGGTGLGLAICKQLCDRMGGTIRVESIKDLGSTFFVDLPFKAAVAPSKMPSDASDLARNWQDADFSGVRVLVVEDHVLNRQLLLALLRKVNVEVTVAMQGEEALDILANSGLAFDLVLMDIQMPVMDGVTATRCIRADQRFDSLPIVAVTANAMSDERAICLEAGMQDYLVKPLERQKLYDCIAKWVH